MAEAGPGAAGGYVAFISYSHKDAKVGRWLHRKLEGYRLPKRLAGTQGEDGEVPTRLTPIFRDRDELPAAGDLSEKVRAALAVSRHLIVVCSPNSAASPWVAKEIATFRELHPGRPIITAIVEGEPEQCFSPALREGGVEPLAADLRKEGDGQRLALLKLVAGMAGIGLDDLVQRDAARRIRRVTYVSATVMAAALAMASLTLIALNARAEAMEQRQQAEGLVEFMITDLRKELKSAAGLKVLTRVSERALEYYQRQDLDDLSVESLEQRAEILHDLGEDDIDRRMLDRALKQFDEAAKTTNALLAEDPDDPGRIFAHAQSEFWIGHVDLLRKNFDRSRRAFQRYKSLSEQLIEKAPQDPKSHMELGYAEGALCSLEVDARGNLDAAVKSCMASLISMSRAVRRSADLTTIGEFSNRYAWLADVYKARGDLNQAWALRLEQERIVDGVLKQNPGNLDFSERWVTAQFSMAELLIDRKAYAPARQRLKGALAAIDKMILIDSTNLRWASHRSRILRDLTSIERL